MITPEIAVTALSPDGRASCSTTTLKRAAQEIAKFSAERCDAISRSSRQSWQKIGRVIGDALKLAPPNIDDPSRGDLWAMLQTGRALRKLGKKDMYRLLRWGPMAVADLVAEFFETELLRATIAARGIFGTAMGPWSAGSSLVLLIRAAGDPHPAGSSFFAVGGMGAVTQAMAAAAKEAGAEIRTGAEVKEVRVKDGVASGVVLANGEEISAKAVISNADPRRTLLKLVDPTHLTPDFVMKLQNYRMPGTVAKVNLALSALPKFTALKGDDDALCAAAFTSARRSITWSAPSTNRSTAISRQHPYLEVAIPSLTDPSLAPEGKHVMSIYMQYAPFKLKRQRLGQPARRAGRNSGEDAGAICAEFAGAD